MKNLSRCLLSIAVITAMLIFTSCSSSKIAAEKKLTVAVSVVPQETFVRNIAGDLVDVVTVIPPGKSPANYSPSPQELEKLSHASIYFTIGVPAENSAILPRLKDINETIRIIDLAALVKAQYPEREFPSGERDPHIWLSPKRAIVMVESIARELSSADNKNSNVYIQNSTNYISELKKLDEDIQNIFKDLKNRAFIIYHPSLGYFSDDYMLTMIPIQSEGKDPSPDDLKMVIDSAKKHNVKTVFYQAEIDSKHSEVIAGELDGNALEIAPLSPDYINNLKKIAASIVDSNK